MVVQPLRLWLSSLFLKLVTCLAMLIAPASFSIIRSQDDGPCHPASKVMTKPDSIVIGTTLLIHQPCQLHVE